MLHDRERAAIDAIWTVKISQDARDLPQAQRCRNLEPDSAEFVCALAAGSRATSLLEIGGSSGISTIALAAAARATGGRLVSIEIEPQRQAESRRTLGDLGLEGRVDYVLADAGEVLDRYADLQFVLIDCEKEDYVRFFDRLRLAPGAIVVADNILSHDLWDYVRHVRAVAGVESVTLPIGKGLEVSRFAVNARTHSA
jgi:predicted O-methyltransferase YrrM